LVLSFLNITHSYKGDSPLFSNVGYTCLPGALLIFKGNNGSGKTTLMKILAGLISPRSGFVFFEDFEISEDYQKYHENISYLGHESANDPDLTLKQNLEFYAGINDSKDSIPAIIKFFSLEENLDKKCKHLSAGWNRRLALSRLMISKKEVWILDEPFSNLDEEVIDYTLKMIASFCDQGGICVITCHSEVKIPFGVEINLTDLS
jgi:heme exporter protein A